LLSCLPSLSSLGSDISDRSDLMIGAAEGDQRRFAAKVPVTACEPRLATDPERCRLANHAVTDAASWWQVQS
jgi:hypothetical protein